MKQFAGIPLAVIFLLSATAPAPAYYHYVQYLSRSAPYSLAQQKFNLAALPAKTVTFFVTGVSPATFPQNDSFSSVLSQVRQAVHTWNAVDTSDLRVAFGGLSAGPTSAAAVPGGQVVFDDLPPGLLGFGGLTTSGGPVTTPSGMLIPAVRGVIHLANDLTRRPGPSYSEGYYLTTVHEMGHALGLQHTFTSSAMSTAATRATSLTRPIDADDIAGLSVLYPTASFSAQNGVIAGRVVSGGAGVHLASVVAIRNGSGAVSALTNPDGSYRIEGVPPGQYYVYAHPLPPQSTSSGQDIVAPLDVNGNPLPPSKPFNTVFYGGTQDYTRAATISVIAGSLTDGVNFNVASRNDVPIYGVSIFSNFNGNVVSPGYLNMAPSGYGGVLAGGTGLTANGNAAPGLKLEIMGGAARVAAVAPYSDPNGTTYLNMGVSYSLGAPTGPEHLLFSQSGFLYVLPSGLNLVQRSPPFVTSVAPNADGSAAITGTSFSADSAIYFDGLPAAIRNLDDVNGQATVIPPPGASGQRATVAVYNHDGQNSLFLQATAPQVFPYGVSDQPALSVTPNALPAGTEAAVTINGVNTHFTAGQTIAGFGSSDIFVRQVFVLSPTQLVANVSIPAKATLGFSEVSAISGFEIAALPGGFAVQPAGTAIPTVIPQLSNATPGQTGAYPGALVTLRGTSLVSGSGGPTVTVAGEDTQVLSAAPDQITFQLPANLPAGPALLKLDNGSASSPAVVVSIDPAPAIVRSAIDASDVPFDSIHPARGGDVVRLVLSGFADPGTVIFSDQVTVSAGGVSHRAIEVAPKEGGTFEVRFVLSSRVASSAAAPVIVYLDGRSSLTAALAVVN